MLERMGATIYRRRFLVILVWVVGVIVSAPFALRAAEHLKPGGFTRPHYPSVQARNVLQERLGFSTVSLEVIFQHPEWTGFDPRFTVAVLSAVAPLVESPEVSSVRTHLDDPRRVSASGHAVYVTIGLNMPLEEAVDRMSELSAMLRPGPLDMTVSGGPALYRDITLTSERDLRRGEALALPLATITLLIVFASLVAAIAPAAVGGAGVAVALALFYFLSQGVDISVFALNIISLLGIGLGIDYSLFYTSRFREELAAGRSVPEAIAVSQRAAGTAIIFSSLTSLIGLVSLTAFDSMVLRSLGFGAVMVIALALVASITLMPALLGVLGHNVNRFAIRLPVGRNRPSFWLSLSNRVMSRPVLVLVPTVALLAFLAVPVKDIRLGSVDATVLPESVESRQGFNILREEFGFGRGAVIPIAYTFEGDPFDEQNLSALYDYGKALERMPHASRVASIVNLNPAYSLEQYRLMYTHPESVADFDASLLLRDTVRQGIVMFLVESDAHPFSRDAMELVARARSLAPTDPSHISYVDGGTGEVMDIIDSIYGRFPYVVAAVMVVTYISLLFLFRSLLLPLKAVILNTLSVLASYGALVFIFQQGHFSGLLNFESQGSIDSTTPVLLFAVLFGLSMDYEIFLLSRIREAYLRTRDNRGSVAEGLQKSGLIITGAAAILIVVAASFVAADIIIVKAIGFGLALAVLVDVTIIRVLVAPALMRIAGKWNWWLPVWLDQRLPDSPGRVRTRDAAVYGPSQPGP